jgi:hypothetical protein
MVKTDDSKSPGTRRRLCTSAWASTNCELTRANAEMGIANVHVSKRRRELD